MDSFLLIYILWPLTNMFLRADWGVVAASTMDREVLAALWRSIWTAAAATGVIALFGTPLAYFLTRKDFRGKAILEAIIDIPIMVPHTVTVAGIAVLMVISPRAPLGAFLEKIGVQAVNSSFGIVLACIFVSIPFYVNPLKDAFASISPRLERASQTFGTSRTYTFFHITLPLAKRGSTRGSS
jgi:molybdate/tungstate transport system permease protein